MKPRPEALAICGAMIFAASVFFPSPSFAVVGQAERYDEFKEQDLKDFHDDLTKEETKAQLERADQMRETLKAREGETAKAKGLEREALSREMETLKKELLQLPKRDRFRFEADGKYRYDSNIERRPIREEKGDSVFNAGSAALFDLSGRKTDLRFEVEGKK